MEHRTDNGPPFNSEKFAAFSEEKGIHHETSFPYHPQANPVECFMKPMGKALKAAHSENLNKEKALDDFLSTYRATPHSATGLAPGDILLRHGYGKDFPRSPTLTDEKVRETLSSEKKAREERADNINAGRRQQSHKVGDQVLTKNETRRKFDPIFGPNPMTITSMDHGGVICQDLDGHTQRRHLDDVKPAPLEGDMAIQEDAQGQRPTPHDTPSETIPVEVETRSRRPQRSRNPNPRYKDYVTDTI